MSQSHANQHPLKPKAEKLQEHRKPQGPSLTSNNGPGTFTTLVGDSSLELQPDQQIAFFTNPRLSHPANAVQRQRLARSVQERYGNRYLRSVMEQIQAARATPKPEDEQPQSRTEFPAEVSEIEDEEKSAPESRPNTGIDWGRATSSPSPWAAAPLAEVSLPCWGTQAIMDPQPAYGRERGEAAGKGENTPRAINDPIVMSVKHLENTYGKNTLGIAPWPQNYTVPQYSVPPIPIPTKGKSEVMWYGTPVLVSKAYEGDSQPGYVDAGTHQTTLTQQGVPVYIKMSEAMARRDHNAELEHANDFRHAFKISLHEAEYVLMKHVIGKKFGPKKSLEELNQMIKATIQTKLAHPDLGSDQTMWGARYKMLQAKTLIRDQKGWHTFKFTNRTVVKDSKGKVEKIVYDVSKGTTKINEVSSATIIKY